MTSILWRSLRGFAVVACVGTDDNAHVVLAVQYPSDNFVRAVELESWSQYRELLAAPQPKRYYQETIVSTGLQAKRRLFKFHEFPYCAETLLAPFGFKSAPRESLKRYYRSARNETPWFF